MAIFNPNPAFFPMPTLRQGSPFGGALSDAIAKRLAMAKAESSEAEVPYTGISKLADVLSKSAYASAVIPQFQAKLLEHPEIAANLKNPIQKAQALSDYGDMGGNLSGGISGFIQNQLQKINDKQNKPSMLGSLGQSLSNVLMKNSNPDSTSRNMNGYTVSSPEQTENDGIMTVSPNAQLSQNYSGQRTPENINYGANIASLKSQVAGGEARGKTAGSDQQKQVDEYGETYEGLLNQQNSINNLKQELQEPVIERISNVPFANQKSLQWYKNTGTKEEKEAVGRLESSLNQFIASSIKSFGAKFTNNDLRFLQMMKPNETELVDVMKGKILALDLFNQMQSQKVKLAHDYMVKGYDKLTAEDMANKKINMNAIEEKIQKELYPAPVKIKTPDGRILTLPKRGAEQLLKDYPGMHKVVE